MVAKCNFAFGFATEAFDAFSLESSINFPAMVSFESENGFTLTSRSGNIVPPSNSCVAVDNSCIAVSSCNAAATNGWLLSSSSCSSASSGLHLATSNFPSGNCFSEAKTDPCVENQNDTTGMKENAGSDDIKSCATNLADLSMTQVGDCQNLCDRTDANLSVFSLVEATSDVKIESNLVIKTEHDDKTVFEENIVNKDSLGVTVFTGKDRTNDDFVDKDGSSSSQWGDPPVLDNSVLWDSHAEPKDSVEHESSSKTSAKVQPLDCKGAVLWDKPPSLIKMEQEETDSNSDESKKFADQPSSRRWTAVSCIGAGLQNLGNTCFVNATLQCLTYTPPLVNYLLAENNNTSCRVDGLCLMCELGRHMTQCFQNSGGVIKPHSILQKLKVIAKHMRWGRQEDAHEFLRYMVDAMNKSCINGHQVSLDNSKETIVNKIFGGYLCSQVTCLQCKAESNTYDPFLDLSLDVKNVPSIMIALQKFVQPETLDIDNAYNCTNCKQKVCAQKRFTIHRLSNILTIQLKRYGVMGGKVTRHIAFPELLDLRPFMSKVNAGALLYQLYGVLVHDGHSTNSGHYYCYIMTAKGDWYCMNDHMVRRSSLSQVLNAEAYLLLYIRQPSSSSSGPSDSINLSNSSPDGNSPIHRGGAVVVGGQHLEERVMCRGGQLPTSCKKGLVSSKVKSILTGSKLQYSKTMQRKAKRRTMSPNFSVAKNEKKTSKAPNRNLPLSDSLLKETCNKLDNHCPLPENSTVVSGPDLAERTSMNVSYSVDIGKKDLSSRTLDRHEIFRNKQKVEEKHQISEIKMADSVVGSCKSSKTDTKFHSIGSKSNASGKLSVTSEKSQQNFVNQNCKKNLSETDKSKSANLQLTVSELSKQNEKSKIFSSETGPYLDGILPKSNQLLLDKKRPIVNSKLKKNTGLLLNVSDNEAKGSQNNEKDVGLQLIPKNDSVLTDNEPVKNVDMNTVDDAMFGLQRKKTDSTVPRIVLKIKQGQVMIEESPSNKVNDSICSKKVKVDSNLTANNRPDCNSSASPRSKVFSRRKLDSKVGRIAKPVRPDKQALQKGSGWPGKTGAINKPSHPLIGSHGRSFALSRKGSKGLSDEATRTVNGSVNGACSKDARSQVIRKSCDVYDFSGESDGENMIREMSSRRSPKASLLKSTSSSHCSSVDAGLNATTVVPGLNIPLDRNPRAFCPRSHQSEKKSNQKQKCFASSVLCVTEDVRNALVKNSSARTLSVTDLPGSMRSDVSHSEICNSPSKPLSSSKKASTAKSKRLRATHDKNRLELQKLNVDGQLNSSQTSKSCEVIHRNYRSGSNLSVFDTNIAPNKRQTLENEHTNVSVDLKDGSCNIRHNTEMDDFVFHVNSTSTSQQCFTSGNSVKTDSSAFLNTRRPLSSDMSNSASYLHNAAIGRRKIARLDHRKYEKRRSLGEEMIGDGNKARESLKRKAKFSGTYDEAELPSAADNQCDRSKSSSLSPISNELALTSIKLKIRKVSTGEDGANVYQVIPPSSVRQSATRSAQRSGGRSSYSRCKSLEAGLFDCSINSAGNLDACSKSNNCSPTDIGQGKSPINSQVREQRNIFHDLEEAVMHSREEFTRQTGLGWSKVDEAGSVPQTETDVTACTFFDQPDFSILSGFNWTTLLNHSLPNDSEPA